MFLAAEPELEVIGEATNGAEALCLAEQLEPDVVLMDLLMPVMDGIAATEAIRRELPGVVVDCTAASILLLERDELRNGIHRGSLAREASSPPSSVGKHGELRGDLAIESAEGRVRASGCASRSPSQFSVIGEARS